MGFRRNLAAWEIVDQVIKIRADSPHPVRGVVFMGMGEPMLNYDHVIQAARILSESCGMAIGGKAITISTAGIVPGIRRFTAEGHIYRLVVSLNSADPVRRRELMPVEKAYPTPELVEAMREYHAATGRRMVLAWTMIAGVNTRDEDARMLADLTRGLPVKLDLIDVNDPTGRFQPPSAAELQRVSRCAECEARRARGSPLQRRPRHSRGLRHVGRQIGVEAASCRFMPRARTRNSQITVAPAGLVQRQMPPLQERTLLAINDRRYAAPKQNTAVSPRA